MPENSHTFVECIYVFPLKYRYVTSFFRNIGKAEGGTQTKSFEEKRICAIMAATTWKCQILHFALCIETSFSRRYFSFVPFFFVWVCHRFLRFPALKCSIVYVQQSCYWFFNHSHILSDACISSTRRARKTDKKN